jgi:hypothetical protein
MITVKMKFKFVADKYAGRILIHNYNGKSLTFTPLTTPVSSSMRCDCGDGDYNATNFGNVIHFCPNREYEFVVTDYFAACS